MGLRSIPPANRGRQRRRRVSTTAARKPAYQVAGARHDAEALTARAVLRNALAAKRRRLRAVLGDLDSQEPDEHLLAEAEIVRLEIERIRIV